MKAKIYYIYWLMEIPKKKWCELVNNCFQMPQKENKLQLQASTPIIRSDNAYDLQCVTKLATNHEYRTASWVLSKRRAVKCLAVQLFRCRPPAGRGSEKRGCVA